MKLVYKGKLSHWWDTQHHCWYYNDYEIRAYVARGKDVGVDAPWVWFAGPDSNQRGSLTFARAAVWGECERYWDAYRAAKRAAQRLDK